MEDYDKSVVRGMLERAGEFFKPEEIVQMLGLEAIVAKSRLSKPAILKHLIKSTIIVEPFKPENLGDVAYDVSLGEHFYREKTPKGFASQGRLIYNPYDEECVRSTWIKQQAIQAKGIAEMYCAKVTQDYFGENIFPEDKIILIEPGETILGHTEEFIGGRLCVTADMRARSSAGRNFIAVCKCAGCGNIGYVNRWTMEITNFSRYYTLPLVVGRRIAQLTFEETEPISADDTYSAKGKYQTTASIAELKKNWKPEDMLPKMWKDREVVERQK